MENKKRFGGFKEGEMKERLTGFWFLPDSLLLQ